MLPCTKNSHHQNLQTNLARVQFGSWKLGDYDSPVQYTVPHAEADSVTSGFPHHEKYYVCMISKEHRTLRGVIEMMYSRGVFPACTPTGLDTSDAKDMFPFHCKSVANNVDNLIIIHITRVLYYWCVIVLSKKSVLWESIELSTNWRRNKTFVLSASWQDGQMKTISVCNDNSIHCNGWETIVHSIVIIPSCTIHRFDNVWIARCHTRCIDHILASGRDHCT